MTLIDILIQLFSVDTLLLTAGGTLAGILLGAIPGLSGPIGVAILLPLTFGMEPANGLLMLGGIYMGATVGGSISAILLNAPGTGEASCTALDGFPLAQQGRAKDALYYSVFSSFLGGLAGVLALLFLTPLLASIALKFGPPEMFMLGLAGLTIVGSLSGSQLSKGFFAVSFGILISLVGTDINTGQYRFTFGINELRAGIDLIPLIVGFFAIAEMVTLARTGSGSFVDVPMLNTSFLEAAKKVLRRGFLVLRTSLLGVGIGILPGTGGAVAAFVGYGEAKRISKSPETFGKGNPEGIIAAESANNAAVGGSLIPLLALGIPGSATAAILYGALTIQGLVPGPKLLTDYHDITLTFMSGMLVTVFVLLFVGVLSAKLFAPILKLKVAYIIPAVIVFSAIGVYSVRNSLLDLGLMMVFGIIGIVFKKFKIPPAPVLLGSILGPMVEQNFGRTLRFAGFEDQSFFTYLLSRPISAILLAFVVLLIFANVRSIVKSRGQETSNEG
ncbi:tripartite tricarboxylate transporter permease [Ahrensia marina]|uniref:DUF112 domain-containing protein n=1 Tax=Ahrensia marina TaxID=1514904 RepID=A0A0M9GL97_9HYPH|nr:tripartite tricarboxylate transporter permease [Ahrensia marina]KPB00373.1 hypothetical protein SU32_14040 [Ahrensia marina]